MKAQPLAMGLVMFTNAMSILTRESVSYHTVRIDSLDIFCRETGPTNATVILLWHGVPSASRMHRRGGALVFQRLGQPRLGFAAEKHGIQQFIVIGLIAHTCIKSTVRWAAELGSEAAVVKDATTDCWDEVMHAALDVDIAD